MMFKIKEIEGFYYVYYLKKGWFKDKWIPFITYRGSDDSYGFSGRISAENRLLVEIKNKHIIHE